MEARASAEEAGESGLKPMPFREVLVVAFLLGITSFFAPLIAPGLSIVGIVLSG